MTQDLVSSLLGRCCWHFVVFVYFFPILLPLTREGFMWQLASVCLFDCWQNNLKSLNRCEWNLQAIKCLHLCSPPAATPQRSSHWPSPAGTPCRSSPRGPQCPGVRGRKASDSNADVTQPALPVDVDQEDHVAHRRSLGSPVGGAAMRRVRWLRNTNHLGTGLRSCTWQWDPGGRSRPCLCSGSLRTCRVSSRKARQLF